MGNKSGKYDRGPDGGLRVEDINESVSVDGGRQRRVPISPMKQGTLVVSSWWWYLRRGAVAELH